MEPVLQNILDPQRQVVDMDSIMQEVENAKLAAELERMATQRKNKPARPQRPVINRTPQERAQVPVSSDTYTIQRGDTLWDISKRTGISIEELARYNGIRDPNVIRAGAKLFIPQRTMTPQAPMTPPAAPIPSPPMQPPQQAPMAPPSPSNGPQNIMGLGGLMRKMGQQVDPTVLGAMAGMGGAGGMAGMMGGRQVMGSALRPNPARGAMNSAMRPNPARMDQTIAGGTQNSGLTLDDLYNMFGRQ